LQHQFLHGSRSIIGDGHTIPCDTRGRTQVASVCLTRRFSGRAYWRLEQSSY
jgi:hypothetical protein